MKRLGTTLVLIVALGLVAASSALADVRAPGNSTWDGIAPANATWTGLAPANASWTGLGPADVRGPSDVRAPSDVRNPSDVRQGISPRGWSDGSRVAPNPWKTGAVRPSPFKVIRART